MRAAKARAQKAVNWCEVRYCMTTFLLLVDFLAFAGVSAIFFSMACRRRYDCKRGGLASEEAVMTFHTTRRGVLGALAAAGFAFDDALAAPLAATPACHDGDEPTIRQTDGPYFKPSSPERADLVEASTKGRLVEITGQVLTRGCRPVGQGLLDLWHADEWGEYDSKGFRYRGHVFTDGEGRYRFRTILPALYPGRTRHYHVK